MFRKSLVPFAAVLTVLLLAGCGTATSNLKVSAGYADNLQTVGARSSSSTFPNPWQGASNVTFKGAGDKFDAGAIRIENPTGDEAIIDQVTVDVGPQHYDLWGTNLKVPANGSLILTQTELGTANPPKPNFDSSEPNPTAASGGTTAGAAAQGSNAVPVIHIKVNGKTTDVRDEAKILNTGGLDKGDLPGSPNESHPWQQIATITAGSSSGGGLSPLLLFAPLAAMLLALFSFIPKLIGALILLAIGWWLAKLVARLVVGFLDRLGFGAAAERTGMFGLMGRTSSTRRTGTRPSWLIGEIVKWFVFLIFVELAAEAFGLAAVTGLLHRIILWIPNLIVALLILFVAALGAQFVGRLVRGGAGRNAGFLGSLVEYGIIALAAVVALNQLGIGAIFVDILFAAVIAALALAAGLAFGLGGRDVTSRIWRNSYRGMSQPQSPQRPPTTTSTVRTPTPIESGRPH
ncbi:MAG: hypothetical protein M3077_00280 [Candidatus Dormibacteraeota bacterium]|nr:hypothetical protein [Candidatus Dormibacteraeota bacterium]